MRSVRLLIALGSVVLACPRAAATDYPNVFDFHLAADITDVTITPDGQYDRISITDGHPDNTEGHIGQPQLPIRNAFFLLPPGKRIVSVDLQTELVTTIPGEFQPLPVLPPDVHGDPPLDVPWDLSGNYPEKALYSVSSGDSRDYYLLKISYYPLSYEGSTRRLALNAVQRLAIVLQDRSPTEETAHIQRATMRDGPFAEHRQWIRSTVHNPLDVDRFYPRHSDHADHDPSHDKNHARVSSEEAPYGSFISDLPSAEGLGPSLVIVTNNVDESGNGVGQMTEHFGNYAAALTSYGIVTTVRTVDWIERQEPYQGFDRADAIRRFLRDCYVKWGTSYVILGGDESAVPTRRIGPAIVEDAQWLNRADPTSDFWYTRLGTYVDSPESWNVDGDAWIGEYLSDFGDYTGLSSSSIFVGRLPARNADEARAMTTKLWRYRLMPPYSNQRADDSFYSSGIVVAGPTNSSSPDNEDCGVFVAEEFFAEPLHRQFGWTVSRMYPDFPSVTCPGGDFCLGRLAAYIIENAPSDPRWVGTSLRDALDGAQRHFVFHMEHSDTDRWGHPTAFGAFPNRDCPRACKPECDERLASLVTGTEHLDENQVLSLRNAPQGAEARFFIAMSLGSYTNAFETNAIGEAFLRAPNGGAVAYVGNTESYYNLIYRPRAVGVAAVDMFDPISGCSVGGALAHALDEIYPDGILEIKEASGLPLLGDPSLQAWRGAPRDALLAVTPNQITSLGVTNLTVTASESGSAVDNALVCVRQSDKVYATRMTNAAGQAMFPGLLIQSVDSLIVTLIAPGFAPKRLAVPISVSAPFVAYVRHDLDDCCQGGDCDNATEAAETLTATVTLGNLGSTTAQSGSALLRATPSFHCDLLINGQYRPEDILIGAKSAHPPAAGESFDLPLTKDGIRSEGPPVAFGTGRDTFKVWRDNSSGSYVVAAVSSSQSADSVFTGVLKGQAAFSSVSMTGEANDAYFWSGDSIWFQFHGDQTSDQITFKAEAQEWVTLPSPSVHVPTLASGSETDVSYPIVLSPFAPDGANLIFTVFAYQATTPNAYFHSDFAFAIRKPEIAVWLDLAAFGDFGCPDTSWALTPIIHNVGSGEADSVQLTLRSTAGSMSLRDSIVTFVRVSPDSFAVAGSFTLCGRSPSDTAGFEGSIRTEVFHRTLPTSCMDHPLDPCPPPAPTNLEADLAGGTVILRWDPVPSVQAYRITCRSSEDGIDLWREILPNSTTRYEVRTHELERPSGANGYTYPYYFLVDAARREEGDEDDQDVLLFGADALIGPIFPWVKERTSRWPKLLPETSICAPTVLTQAEDGASAILAAGARIYGWRPDGSPLDTDSLLYDPIGADPIGVDTRFTEALATGPWFLEPNGSEALLVAGNLRNDGVHLIKLDPKQGGGFSADLYREYPVSSALSPIVAWSYYVSGTYQTALWLAGTADNFINEAIIDDASAMFHCAETVPAGSSFNFQSLAIGHNTTTHIPELIAVSRGTKWKRGQLACYPMTVSGLTQPRWADSLDDRSIAQPMNQWLSTPAVGDIDGDGDHDVVVTSLWRCLDPSCSSLLAGKILIVDEDTGVQLTCTGGESPSFHFRRASDDLPPAGPTLADLDADGDMEIVLAGNTSDPDTQDQSPVALTVHVFGWNNGSLDHWEASQSIPYGERMPQHGNVHECPGCGGKPDGALYPIGSAVVAEVDYDGLRCRPDIFVSSSAGAICAFEYDPDGPEGPSLYAKPGWPLVFPGVPREPVVAVLDETNPNQYSMVVQCQDGWLHVLDLPRPSPVGVDCGYAWQSYGGYNVNSRFQWQWDKDRELPPDEGITVLGARPSFSVSGLVRSSSEADVLVYLSRSETVDLSVYDAGGRRIATVYSGLLAPGSHRLHWDGRTYGRPVSSGIYWYRLKCESGTQSRRVVVVR